MVTGIGDSRSIPAPGGKTRNRVGDSACSVQFKFSLSCSLQGCCTQTAPRERFKHCLSSCSPPNIVNKWVKTMKDDKPTLKKAHTRTRPLRRHAVCRRIHFPCVWCAISLRARRHAGWRFFIIRANQPRSRKQCHTLTSNVVPAPTFPAISGLLSNVLRRAALVPTDLLMSI